MLTEPSPNVSADTSLVASPVPRTMIRSSDPQRPSAVKLNDGEPRILCLRGSSIPTMPIMITWLIHC
ncbi:hypothetical protein HZ326_27093 [Fusarium oxysporum f. sp. albedinis]|nr:hypothetical protein HZ326_27093 [Fusarium oxysporum f. sp. albedinis]